MFVIYFSGTGNSKYIAQQFAKRMHTQAYDIEQKLKFDELFEKEDTIAVCYPIYGSCVPLIMRKFVAKYKNCFQDKKLIIFCTQMLFSGDGARAFTRLLPGCDKRVIYAEHFMMPNNICNFFLFPITEKEKSGKSRKALKKLDRVCSHIRRGIVKKRGWNPISTLLGKTQNVAFRKIERQGRSSFRTDQSCIGCGLCVKKCPTRNLEMKDGKIEQKGRCTLCYRCVNLCPKQSCTVLVHQKPKKQYKGIEGGNDESRNRMCR